jgi:hypothetical protein
MRHIIFGMDSRGAKLNKFLNQDPFDFQSTNHIIVRPGGKLGDVKNLVQKKVLEISKIDVFRTIWIIFAAGICNMTRKITHSGGTEIQYIRSDSNIQSVIAEFKEIQNFFHSFNNIFVKFTCIPSVSLDKFCTFNMGKGKLFYSIFTPDERKIQQSNLEEDLKIINLALQSFSVHAPVRWDRDLLLCSTKKRGRKNKTSKKVVKTSYASLYDGVHPNDDLSHKWYSFMCHCLSIEILQASLSDSESDTDDEASWDFKRN